MDDIVLRGGNPYDPSVCLTPACFKGNKNLTISKIFVYPKYYNSLHELLPNSVFIPNHNEGFTKETVSLCLIIDAFEQNLHPLVSDLQKTVHFELINEELPVMKARLKYLMDYANEQDLVKIQPECPFEA